MISYSKNSFLYQCAHSVFSKILLLFLGLAVNVIVSRSLGPVGKGNVSLLQSIPLIIISFCSLGVRQSSAYFIGKNIYDEQDVLSSMLCVFYIVSFVSIPLALICFWVYGIVGQSGLIISFIFASIIPFELYKNYTTGILISGKKIEQINNIYLFYQLIFFTFILVLVYFFKIGVLGVAIASLTAQLISTYILRQSLVKCFSLTPKIVKDIPYQLVAKGISFAATLFILQLNYRLDIFILAKLKTQASVGIYSVGVGLAELLQQIPLAIGLVLFSRSANWKYDDLSSSLSKLTLLSRLSFLLAIISSTIILIASYWLIPILFGFAFKESFYVLCYLILGVIALTIFHNIHIFAAGQGKPYLAIYTFAPALFINILLNFILIPKYDFIGSSIASMVSYTIATIAYIYIFNRIYKTCFSDFFIPKLQDINLIFPNWLSSK